MKEKTMPTRERRTVHVEGRDYGKRWDFFVLKDTDDARALAQPVVFEDLPVEAGMYAGPGDPTFSLFGEDAQSFFEAMWRAGFRSKHDRGSIDTLDAARKEHIADLRRAAFDVSVPSA
jgi:hypothetical protein